MTKQLFTPKKQFVNRYTRAGVNGKVIICPQCNTEATVYHFSWCALTCQSCGESINKTDYLLEVN